jgi:hypothetical protein
MSPLLPLPPTFAATVAALHSVAERIVAPARKPDNEIALEATPGGFGTPVFEHDGVRQQVRVDGVDLVRTADGDERRTELTTLEAARRLVADLVPEALNGEPLGVDREAAARLADWHAFGAAILAEIADGSPVRLWPEHFDVAIELGEANYGFSPGDEEHPEPYAYVGPWTAEVSGELWQANGFRGAELTYAELLAAPDQRAAALDFLTSRKEALA